MNRKKVIFLNDYTIVNNTLVRKTFTENNLPEQDHNIEEEPGDGENITIDKNDDKFIWDRKAILLLLDEYHQRINDFRNPTIKKKALWKKIAEVMVNAGYEVDGDMIDRKIRNMRATFNKIKDNNQKKRTGRGAIQWEYYDKLSAILTEDKTVNPTSLISTLPLSINIPQEFDNSNPDINLSSPTSPQTPSNCRQKQKKLDEYRNRQLELESERVEELKKIRLEMEESNKINREKLEVFKQYMANKT